MDSDSELSSAPPSPQQQASSPANPMAAPVDPPSSPSKGAKNKATPAKPKAKAKPPARGSARKASMASAATDDASPTAEEATPPTSEGPLSEAQNAEGASTPAAGRKRRASAANTASGVKKLKLKTGSTPVPTSDDTPVQAEGEAGAKAKGKAKKARQSISDQAAPGAEGSGKENKNKSRRRVVESSPESEGEEESGSQQPAAAPAAPTPGRATGGEAATGPAEDVTMASPDAPREQREKAAAKPPVKKTKAEREGQESGSQEGEKAAVKSKPVKKVKADESTQSPAPTGESTGAAKAGEPSTLPPKSKKALPKGTEETPKRKPLPATTGSSAAKAGEKSDTPLAKGTPDPKIKASAIAKKKAALADSTGKPSPAGSPATEGSGSVPRMSGLLANTLAALSQTPKAATSEKKKKEDKPVKRIAPAWSDDWAMTAEQKKQYDSLASEREAMKAEFAKWKANAVNLQEAKDAYKLDAVQPREIPLPRGAGVGIKPDQYSRPSVVIQAMIDSAKP